MEAQEYYDIIEGCNGWWKETTNGENVDGDIFVWMFHQPTKSVPEGLYIIDYRLKGRIKRETGEFLIEIKDNHVSIKVKDHFYELSIEEDGGGMIWKSNNLIKRTFILQQSLIGSDNIYAK